MHDSIHQIITPGALQTPCQEDGSQSGSAVASPQPGTHFSPPRPCVWWRQPWMLFPVLTFEILTHLAAVIISQEETGKAGQSPRVLP